MLGASQTHELLVVLFANTREMLPALEFCLRDLIRRPHLDTPSSSATLRTDENRATDAAADSMTSSPDPEEDEDVLNVMTESPTLVKKQATALIMSVMHQPLGLGVSLLIRN